MAYSITYTTAGTTYNLNGVNAGLGVTVRYLGDQGFGMAPMHRITQRGPLQQALEAYFRVLDGVTLADLVAQQKTAEGVPLRWSRAAV